MMIDINLLEHLQYLSQDTLDPSPEENGFATKAAACFWRDRCCGIACVRMILSAVSDTIPTLSHLIERGVCDEAYVNGVGWRHQGLAKLLSDYGLHAETMSLNSEGELNSLLQKGWVGILSIRPSYEAQKSENRQGGHLILCHGYRLSNCGKFLSYLVSDPDYDAPPSYKAGYLDVVKLSSTWARRGIFVKSN